MRSPTRPPFIHDEPVDDRRAEESSAAVGHRIAYIVLWWWATPHVGQISLNASSRPTPTRLREATAINVTGPDSSRVVLRLGHAQHPTGAVLANHVVDRRRHQPAGADYAQTHAFIGRSRNVALACASIVIRGEPFRGYIRGTCHPVRRGGMGTYATVVGGAAAALVGLLFVAVSIRVDAIAASGELRNRAAQTLGLFLTVLFVAVFLAVPDQSLGTLGGEGLVLAIVAGSALYVLDRRAKTERTPQPLGRVLDAVAPNAVTSILLMAAGVVLIFNVHAGLYVLIAPVLAALAGGVINAWLFLTRITN